MKICADNVVEFFFTVHQNNYVFDSPSQFSWPSERKLWTVAGCRNVKEYKRKIKIMKVPTTRTYLLRSTTISFVDLQHQHWLDWGVLSWGGKNTVRPTNLLLLLVWLLLCSFYWDHNCGTWPSSSSSGRQHEDAVSCSKVNGQREQYNCVNNEV